MGARGCHQLSFFSCKRNKYNITKCTKSYKSKLLNNAKPFGKYKLMLKLKHRGSKLL